MKSIAGLALVLFATQAHADDCGPAALAKLRGAAEKQMKAGNVKAARATLEDAGKRCSGATHEAESWLWLMSDRIFAAYKDGDKAGCAKLLEAVSDSEELEKYPRLAKALFYNAKLCTPREDGCDYKLDHDVPYCQLSLAAEYAGRSVVKGFEAKKCPVKKHEDAVVVDDATCIELGAFERKGKEEDLDATCGELFLVDAKGKKTRLDVPDSWLTSTSDCCNAHKVSVKLGKDGAQILVASDGPSRDCFGGTATSDYMTVFDLKGGKLVVSEDLTVGWH
jgi:hypothetical protein